MIVPTLNSSIAFPSVILTAPVMFCLTWWLFARKGKHQKKKEKENLKKCIFLKHFFDVTIFKVFIEFVTVLLLLHALDFWLQGHGILAP